MATAAPYWQRRPVYESMQYNGPEDLEDLRAWVATKNTEASETVVKRIDPTEDGGFQFEVAWVWDQDRPYPGPIGVPTDWVVFHFSGSLYVITNENFTSEFEPAVLTP